MTATKKEVILEYIATTLGNIAGITIYRDRTEAFRREECPCVNIIPIQNVASYGVIDFAEWTLQFSVKIYTRGTLPDNLADALERDIYAALMVDRSLSAKVFDITPVGVYYQVLEGDQPIGITDLVFQTTFRTMASDLTQ